MSDIELFFDTIYGGLEGYAYSPVKTATGEWQQYFFKWPEERQKLIDFQLEQSKTQDVYYSPALFNIPSALKEHYSCSKVCWVEFDGNAPTNVEGLKDGIPTPSIIVQSSSENHQHWLWLHSMEVGTGDVEIINRTLAYKLESDVTGWDKNQVLRAPGTGNFKRGTRRDVRLLLCNNSVVHSLRDSAYGGIGYSRTGIDEQGRSKEFGILDDVKSAPNVIEVILRYAFTDEESSFFRREEIKEGSRSSALMRLAYTCREKGMTELECYSMLDNADTRWGKFAGRSDREQRIKDLVLRAFARERQSISFESQSSHNESYYGFNDFLQSDIHIEWEIEGLLEKYGQLVLTGPPASGKSQFSLQVAMHMALGKEFLGWKMPSEETRIIFFSMEMHHGALKHFLEIMAKDLSDDDRAILNERLFLVPLGRSINLESSDGQKFVTDISKRIKPSGLIYDSLGSTVLSNMSDDSTIKGVIGWDEEFRSNNATFSWFIHHQRKSQIGNKKPKSLDDVFGSMYIAARATTVLGLYPELGLIELATLKMRLAEQPKPFLIERTNTLNFKKSTVAPSFMEGDTGENAPFNL